MSDVPVYPHDLFAPEALREPFGHYRALRDLGPVVRLNDPDVYALARFADVRDALRASAILASGDEVLVEHCGAPETGAPETGAPEVHANRGLYGFARLQLELRSAA